MSPLTDLRRPGLFLVAFAAATAVALAAWQLVSRLYLAGLVWAANHALSAAGGHVTLRVPAPGDEVVYPVVAGAVALFAVTPGRSPGWKLRWLAGLLAGLFLLQAGTLCLAARAALAARAPAAAAAGPGSWTDRVAGLADLARTQLPLVLVTLTWLLAMRRRSGSGGAPEVGCGSTPTPEGQPAAPNRSASGRHPRSRAAGPT
ncbi:MAG: hypothetical protein ABIL09_02045 [Gemmatimonadota bacterium]